jgi:predicted nuclease of restriction endonuclease-like (RecB) superfamily
MDLKQTKLTRTEWDSIETPVSPDEKTILELIVRGYENVQIKENETSSLFTFTKVEKTPEIELFLYKKYFEPIIEKIAKTAKLDVIIAVTQSKDNGLKKLKSIDSMRLKNLESNIDKNRTQIFEFLLLDLCSQFCIEIDRKSAKTNQCGFYLYTLIQLKKTSITHINSHVVKFVDFIIEKGNQRIKLSDVIENAYEFIDGASCKRGDELSIRRQTGRLLRAL